MAEVLNIVGEVDLKTEKAMSQLRRFESVANKSFKNNGLGSITADTKNFDKAIGAATNRVVAFGAATVIFNTFRRSVSELATSVIQVDQALAKININLNQSGAGIKKFGSDLFNIARQTGQSFEVTAKAAEELSRQGLGVTETTKRLNAALMLSRITGTSVDEAISGLTSTINTFSKEALTGAQIVSKFTAVSTQFAVSSKDLSEAITQVSSRSWRAD